MKNMDGVPSTHHMGEGVADKCGQCLLDVAGMPSVVQGFPGTGEFMRGAKAGGTILPWRYGMMRESFEMSR